MRTEFKREMNRNYMVLHPEKQTEKSYSLRMLSENRITGLLPFREKQVDGESYLYFDITSKQALSRMMEYRSFTAKEIRRILEDLIMTMTSLEKFLMDGDQLTLEPDLVYVDPDNFKANFCLIPGKEGSFTANFRMLSRYILDHVDHTDGDAVILAFALFRAGEKENLGILDLELCLQADGKNSGETEKQRTYEEKVFGGLKNNKRREMQTYQKGKLDGSGEFYAGKPEQRERKRPGKDRDWELESEEQKRADEPEDSDVKKKLIPILLGACVLMVPAMIFFIGGIEMLIRLKWGILAAWGILLSGILITGKRQGENGEDEAPEEEEWESVFREEEETEQDRIPEWGYEERRCEQIEERTGQEEEDEMHTVLLTGRQIYPMTRRLVPENGGENIRIGYFPFLIGKNREITDLCLNLPQISRIHAKIEEAEGGYMITDLNSTNGTSVNGCFLETNESVPIAPGDLLSFADQKYRFL